jgi:hypothetical protein
VNTGICRLPKADVAIERALLVARLDSVCPTLQASVLFGAALDPDGDSAPKAPTELRYLLQEIGNSSASFS